MPIVTVELVEDPGQPLRPDAAQALADAIGGCLGTPPGGCWVRVRSLGRDTYAENAVPRDALAAPVFVTVLQRDLAPVAELEPVADAVTRAVAATLDRLPEHVHVEFSCAASGRMAFGGVLVR